MPPRPAGHYASTDCPFGTLWVASGDRGVVLASYGLDELAFCHDLERAGFEPEYDPEGIEAVILELQQYFAGTRTVFERPVDLDRLPSFHRIVLLAVADVPYGEVRSYGEIASAVGRPRAARAVGTALARNPVSFFIPCHRIVRSDGTLGEYGGMPGSRHGAEQKRMLLAREGVYL